jgi:hypothetical protein
MKVKAFSLLADLCQGVRDVFSPRSTTLYGARASVLACEPVPGESDDAETGKRFLLDALIRPAQTGDAWAPEELALLSSGGWNGENRPRVLNTRLIDNRRFVSAAGRTIRGVARIRLEVAVDHPRTPLRFVHRDAVFGEISLPEC